MSLSVIIPSHNPDALAIRNILNIAERQPRWRFILVDDGSARPLSQMLPSPLPRNIRLLRNETPQGAGAARNAALRHARETYTVFLDDDDIMHWDIVEEIMHSMDENPSVDVACCLYDIFEDGTKRPAHRHDIEIVDTLLASTSQRVIGLAGNERILRLTNFPWNKVYRTEFLHRISLRFSETKTQNDVFAHWQTLVGAARILVSRKVQCTKTQNRMASRISNTRSRHRLQAFEALRDTCEFVQEVGNPVVEAHFWGFCFDLYHWMRNVAAPDVRGEIDKQYLKLVGMIPPGPLPFEQHAGCKKWELWTMPIGGDIIDGDASDGEEDTFETPGRAEWSIMQAEVSRLSRLADELIKENNTLRGNVSGLKKTIDTKSREIDAKNREINARNIELDARNIEIDNRDRELNSKAVRSALRIRAFYRTLFPVNHP